MHLRIRVYMTSDPDDEVGTTVSEFESRPRLQIPVVDLNMKSWQLLTSRLHNDEQTPVELTPFTC